jgi:5-methylthioadenosine/S-adenosylhomocysteine deaminase
VIFLCRGHMRSLIVASIVSLATVVSQPASAQPMALRGTIVAPFGIIDDGTIAMSGPTIVSVSPGSSPASEPAVEVDGILFPGLIDLHNHLTWNVFPRWTPPSLSRNRYEWQEMPQYAAALSDPHAGLVRAGYDCDLNRYGELKAIVNGATATVGSIRDECIRGLARNLDFLSELAPQMHVGDDAFRDEIFPFEIRSSCGEQAMRDVGRPLEECAVNPGETRPVPPRAVVAHVAEGIDASARREFAMFAAHGYLHPGANIIHGVGLRAEHFRQMASSGVGLIWSPRSNIDLYGQTADVAAARAAGVLLAIAPDWSPSGSTGMLAELAFVDRFRQDPKRRLKAAFTSKELVEMATINPARLARLDDRIGKLAPGYAADVIVMRRPGRTPDRSAYDALVHQRPTDLLLVVVGGTPIFGEPALMRRLVPIPQQLETITVCGQPRMINVRVGTYQGVAWADTEARLHRALAAYSIPLAPFVECAPDGLPAAGRRD